MSSWILTLIVPLLIGALWHGLSLQLSCALAGERSPRFLRAMWVSWLGGLLGAGSAAVWSWTFGLIVSLFISSWLAFGLGILLQLFVTASVYRSGLKLTGPAAFGVTGIHALLSWGVNALLAWFAWTALFGA